MTAYDFECPEGATPIDPSGLKIAWVKTQADLNRVEAENIANATRKYLLNSVNSPQAWFDISALQTIHKDMLSDVWDWAGEFRRTETSIGTRHYLIRDSLARLCEDVSSWRTKPCELTFIEQAARIHHQLVLIHPFSNGNGRFSRLVADRYLKAWNCPYPNWPTDLHKDGQARHSYIHALRKADSGDYDVLVEYCQKHGAKDPTLRELLTHPFFKQRLKDDHLYTLMESYLRRDHSLDSTPKDRHSLLHVAVKRDLLDITELLIRAGGDIHSRDKSGHTSFETAIIQRHFRIAKKLCDHGYPYIPRQPAQGILLNYYDCLEEFDHKFF